MRIRGKALLGHLNRSINLLIKPSPGDWAGPLEAIKMRNGDCKSYSIAKYAAARLAGIPPDHIRLAIVFNQRHSEDHMVAAVHQDGQWLMLDNLTNLLLRDFGRKRLRAPSYFGLQRRPSLSFGVLVQLGATNNDYRSRRPRASWCVGPHSPGAHSVGAEFGLGRKSA